MSMQTAVQHTSLSVRPIRACEAFEIGDWIDNFRYFDRRKCFIEYIRSELAVDKNDVRAT